MLTQLPFPAGPPLHELAAALPAQAWPMLLDSGPPAAGTGAGPGAWNLLVAHPQETLRVRVGDGRVSDPSQRALGHLQRLIERRWPGARPVQEAEQPLPAFAGGAVAVLGYELGRQLEARTSRAEPDECAGPDLLAGLYPFVLAEERDSGRRLVLGRGTREQAEDFARSMQVAAERAPPLGGLLPPAGPLTSTFDADGYMSAVRRVLEHILDGDAYQVNLSQRFELPWAGDVAALHAALRERSPVPYGACIRVPGFALVSNSPELFLQRRGRQLSSGPIKGTRPRGSTPAEDQRLRAQLESSDKERAELAMIVDLVRNDLGRSAQVGSVEVQLPFGTEAWATVFHRVATVRCQLPEGARTAAVIEAAFPPASVTGTPKISAMEVIESLEPVRRHAYTGALGWLDAGGDFELSVAIRIVTAAAGRLLLPVGGGITLASDPAAEYEETLHKARAVFDVLQIDPSRNEVLIR